jgi:hypothetical protein
VSPSWISSIPGSMTTTLMGVVQRLEGRVGVNAAHCHTHFGFASGVRGLDETEQTGGRAGGNPCPAECVDNQRWRRVQRCSGRPCGRACRWRKGNRCGANGNRRGACGTSSLGAACSRYN